MTPVMTLAIALLGAVLGVINLWRAWDRDRVKLRVAAQAWVDSSGQNGLGIEVINLSYFPVTVTQVGFDRSDRQIYLHPALLKDLPKRLEARAAFTGYLPAGADEDENFALVTRAFAKTACGCRFTAGSAALRHAVQRARAAAS